MTESDAPETPEDPKWQLDIEENTHFWAFCSYSGKEPLAYLQLVSNVSRLRGFVPVVEGCGDGMPICYRPGCDVHKSGFDPDPVKVCDLLPDASANGMELWCRVVNGYLSKTLFSFNANDLHDLCTPLCSFSSIVLLLPTNLIRRFIYAVIIMTQ